MTNIRPGRLKLAHRIQMGVTLLAGLALLVLSFTAILDGSTALVLFLMLELPMLVLMVGATVLRVRRSAVPGAKTGFLDWLEAEEPLFRPLVYELRAFQSLGLLLIGKRRVDPGALAFGYTKGTMTFPVVVLTLSLVELVIVHLLVPWLWLSVLLLAVTIWSVLFVFGIFASRIVNPHVIVGSTLILRWGHQTVLEAPMSRITSATLYTNHAYTQPQADGQKLVLTQFQSTNLRITFEVPVEATPPVSRKHLPPNFHALEVELFVDDPGALVQAIKRQTEAVIE